MSNNVGSTELQELREDIAELERLRQSATRKKVQVFLDNQIVSLKNKLSSQYESVSSQSSNIRSEDKDQKVQNDKVNEEKKGSNVIYHTVSGYAYDDDIDRITLYINQQNDVEKIISIDATELSVDVRFKTKSPNEKYFKLLLNPLHDKIIGSQAKCFISSKDSKRVIIRLPKKSKKSWPAVLADPSKKKNKQDDLPSLGKNDDPSAGLMNLMKKMYEDGDEEMKRTIAKAWTESQEKKGGFGGGF